MTLPGYLPVAETGLSETEHRRLLAKKINSILGGKMNAVTTLTLTANVATTTLTDNRITPKSFIGLQPLTANAATALATTYVLVANQVNSSAILTHANNAQTDRNFNVIIIG